MSRTRTRTAALDALAAALVCGGITAAVFVLSDADAAQVQPVSVELAPCQFEDGPGPCRWQADEAGNGRGLSYTISCAQVFTYDDPAANRRLGGPADTYPSTCEQVTR